MKVPAIGVESLASGLCAVSAVSAMAGAPAGPAVEQRTESHDVVRSDPFYPSPWMNPQADGWAEAYAKAKDFVSQLTLLEKINLTTGVGWEGAPCVGNTGDIPRLGFRGLCLQDSPTGVRYTDYNSVFTSGQTAAATWDRNLIYARSNAMAYEFKGKGVDVMLTPVAGPLGRAPEGGRIWEGFAADPYFTGVAMAESVRGIQDAGVLACAKHFIGNEQEHFRQVPEAHDGGFNITETISSNIDDKTLHELYLWPFADAVRAGVASVMCSYQQVNNSYSCQNSNLLNRILKKELGFQGFVMSDWTAQHTGVASAAAGLDMSMPGDTAFNSGFSYWGSNLTIAVLNGTLPQWRVDDMAMRIMAAYFKVGRPVKDQPPINFNSWTLNTYGPYHASVGQRIQQVNWHVDVRADHANLIRLIGAKGTVLLKNNGVLPLNKPKFLAVIGEDAGANPSGPNGCSDRGCNNGTLTIGWGSGTANLPYVVTPDDALKAQALADGSVYQSILANNQPTQTQQLVSQVNATAIVFVNANSGEGFINVGGNIGDRNNLTLWSDGDALVKNVSSWCANTIVVIHSPGPVLVTDWHDSPNITAILWAGMPGQESGHSITDVLYGHVNPSGRSPFTWGATRESYGTDVLYKPNNGMDAPQSDFSEGVFIDYRHFDKVDAPLIYEFGYGLSYTTFEYSNLKVDRVDVPPYVPVEFTTMPAPVLGNSSNNPEDYVFPKDLTYIDQYIYPYLNSSDPKTASRDANYGKTADQFLPPYANDGSARSLVNTPGGNARLWDVIFTVSADIKNTGPVAGNEVPQLYVSLGGPDDPKVQLRGFDNIRIDPGQTATFKAYLTRRDLSNWDTTIQDWVVSASPKTVYVGPSSRKLPLTAPLTAPPGSE